VLYRISTQGDFLRADLFYRESAEEAREFFGAVAHSALRRRCFKVLVSVYHSSPLFTVDRSGFLTQLTCFGGDSEHKIALLADSEELDYSHEYLELLGQQHGINVRHFRSETTALEWLRPGSQTSTLSPVDVTGVWPTS
jgi:hypothetical protein